MTRNDLSDRIDYARRDLEFLRSIVPSCLNCDDYLDGYCKRYQSRPPSDFVAQGCDQWNYDDVPF